MSAISGIWRTDHRPDADAACARMLAALEIYGPDAGAQWSGGEIALGRRLMRLLPEDEYDRQPVIGAGGRYVLVVGVAERSLNGQNMIADLHNALMTFS